MNRIAKNLFQIFQAGTSGQEFEKDSIEKSVIDVDVAPLSVNYF